ncbi:MAG: ABC transporter permease [Candidatus Electrothrix scaldis]|nr:MAG: ABC transporter permease [Candidatus Electrothrix sp. GW3-3]
MNSLLSFLHLLYTRRRLITAMAFREIREQYVGSSLGLMWTVIHPLVMITVFWFVFSVGFKTQPQNDVPFVVWLTAGLAPWYLFSNIISGATNIILTHSHLVKKTIFSSQILPVIKILSSLVTHAIFLVVLLVLLVFQKMPVSVYYLQAIYYLFCMLMLSLGLSWTLAALNVFIRDVSQLVTVFLQIGFWMTPIFWDISMMPPKVQWFLKLNPVYYLVQGYRESFISFQPFWSHLSYTAYYWFVTFAMLASGAYIFKKLKPQFPDVL